MFPKSLCHFLLITLCAFHVVAKIGDTCKQGVSIGTCQKTGNCTTGAIVKGLCPNNPVDVRCCFPHYPCNVDTPFQVCQDKNKARCNGDHGYFANLCPGNNEVQCCLSKSTVDKFIDFLKKTYDLAIQYKKSKSGGTKDANILVMEWMRHEKYDGLKSGWTSLLGSVDGDWISFAKGKKHVMFDQFADPHYCGLTVETDHLSATMNIVARFPPLAYPYVNRGDFGGWGGELITLYADWQSAGKPAGRAYAKSMILGKRGSFKLQDAIEDIDGFNLGLTHSMLPASPIHVVAASYYKPNGGYRSRGANFFKRRFENREHARTLAYEMLTGPGYRSPGDEDSLISLLRTALIQKEKLLTPLPSRLKKSELDPLIDGFVDAIEELANDKGKTC